MILGCFPTVGAACWEKENTALTSWGTSSEIFVKSLKETTKETRQRMIEKGRCLNVIV
jgi:hypothetical protein